MSVLHYCQAPRVGVILAVALSIFLLSFVLVGCVHPSNPFASIYLVEFEYNTNSPHYAYIQESLNDTTMRSSSNNTNLPSDPYDGAIIRVRAGLMGICTVLNDEVLCTSQNINHFNSSQLHPVSNFTIFEGRANTELGSINLLDLARKYSSRDKYGLVLASLISLSVALLSFAFVAFFMVPPTSWRNLAGYVGLGLGLVFVLVSNMVMHTGSKSTETMVRTASMDLVSVTIASKTVLMYWFAFVFVLLGGVAAWPAWKRLEDEVYIEKEKAGLRV